MKASHRKAFAQRRQLFLASRPSKKAQQLDFEPYEIAILYHFAVALAAVLTLTCPIEENVPGTIAWNAKTQTWNLWYLMEACVLFSFIAVAFFKLQCSDPGYLTPKLMKIMDDEEEEEEISGNGHKAPLVADETKPYHQISVEGYVPRPRKMTENGTLVSLSSKRDPSVAKSLLQQPSIQSRSDNNNNPRRRGWCRVCRLYPPLRAHHCRICNRCVATFDHHCEFLATCIGERNRCCFWMLMAAQAIGVTRCCTVLVAHVDDGDLSIFSLLCRFFRNWKASLHWSKWNWILIRVYCAKAYIYVLALAALFMFTLHTLWALTNSTTFEWSKGNHLAYLNGIKPYQFPFYQGSVRNLEVYGCFGRVRVWRPILWRPPGKPPDPITEDVTFAQNGSKCKF